jgi:CBS domain-containing protein
MLRYPKLCSTDTTVGQARTYLVNDHVHVLLVAHDDHLVAVVERGDLAGAAAADLVWPLGRLAGRIVAAGADLAAATRVMDERGCRRLAVVDEDGRLAGLLCRKRSRKGFCSDDGVTQRAAERLR